MESSISRAAILSILGTTEQIFFSSSMALTDLSDNVSAIFSATCINFSGGATLLTRPILSASLAPMGSPSITISFALGTPTIWLNG
jgi:hypothetical protein